MSGESSADGGGMKYALIGLLLLGGAVGIYFLTKGDPPGEPPVAAVFPDAGPARSTAFAEPEIVIPESFDAGEPDAGQAPGETRIRYVRGTCNGEISAAAASRVIGENSGAVRACYERALKSNHGLQGRLSLMLQVGASGQVQSVQVGGSLRDPTVFSCVRSVASRWRFPAPTGGCAVVSAPFSFTPRN